MTALVAAVPAHSREQEVKLLVDLVRLARVTILSAEPGAEKSELLKSEVMPLLGAAPASGGHELAILFDTWDKAPLRALLTRVQDAVQTRKPGAAPKKGAASRSLLEQLAAWQEELDISFLFVFDQFEEYLQRSADSSSVKDFDEAFVQLVNDSKLRAKFLISLDETAEPLLARFRDRIWHLRDARVRLPRASNAAPVRTVLPSSTSAASAPPAHTPAPVRAMQAREHELHRAPAPAATSVKSAPMADEPQPVLRIVSSEASVPAANAAKRTSSPEVSSEPRVAAGPPISAAPSIAAAMSAKAKPSPSAQTRVETETPAIVQKEAPLATADVVPVAMAAGASVKATSENKIELALEPDSNKPLPRAAVKSSRARVERKPITFGRIVWIPIVIVLIALFWMTQAKRNEPAQPVAQGPSEAARPQQSTRTDSEGTAASTNEKRASAPPAPTVSSPRTAASSAPEVRAATEPAAPKAAPAVTESAKPSQLPSSAAATAALPQAPRTAASETRPGVSPATSSSAKPATVTAAQKPVPSAQPEQSATAIAQKTPATKAARTSQALAPNAAAAAPAARAAEVVETRPPAIAQAGADAPSGPVLYINVRTEAQRARAEQIVRPLGARGIRVAGIRLVNAGPSEPDLRYFRLEGRDEALKVAVALRDVGLPAQQLRHVDEQTPASARQYELWLPASDN